MQARKGQNVGSSREVEQVTRLSGEIAFVAQGHGCYHGVALVVGSGHVQRGEQAVTKHRSL